MALGWRGPCSGGLVMLRTGVDVQLRQTARSTAWVMLLVRANTGACLGWLEPIRRTTDAAVLLACMGCGQRLAPQQVDATSHVLQVARPDAEWHATKMVKFGGAESRGVGVGPSVRQDLTTSAVNLRADSKDAVASRAILRTCPQPARTGLDHLGPEAVSFGLWLGSVRHGCS